MSLLSRLSGVSISMSIQKEEDCIAEREKIEGTWKKKGEGLAS